MQKPGVSCVSTLPATHERIQRLMGTVLAFDFGEKRIGVATGETLLASAHPLTVIHAGIQ